MQGTQQDRLESFYRNQADDYDAFRDRLLGGRQALIASLVLPEQAHILELGAGTGANVLRFSPIAQRQAQFTLVDLCPSLLAQAKQRFAKATNVEVITSPAASFDTDTRFDAVVLSYALTMMPDFAAVIDNAARLLKPGGSIAVVDFYLWRGGAPADARHGALQRAFWSRWFAHDGVALDDRRLKHLANRFPDHTLHEWRQRVPWMGGLRVPCYRFVGTSSLHTS